jgi:cell growth-regulating nucleolar protein
VFFVCEGCNESLKKNQVDKHASRCRSCHAVTCVDCSVTFYGNDYAAHLVCVSEAEKYEKTLYKAKAVTKLNPQESWIALIEDAASRSNEAPSHVRQYVLRLNELGNVPRNKGKFVNFVKNSIKINNTNTIEDIWKFLEVLKGEKDVEKAAQIPVAVKSSGAAAAAAADETSDILIPEVQERTDAEIEAKKARKAERKRLRESAQVTPDAENESTEFSIPEVEPRLSSEIKKTKKAKKQKSSD